MPDAFVALLNFAPPEILECYLPSFDGELAPPSIEWGQCACRLAWGRGHRGNRIAMQTGSNTPLFGGAGASSPFLLFATGSNRPGADIARSLAETTPPHELFGRCCT